MLLVCSAGYVVVTAAYRGEKDVPDSATSTLSLGADAVKHMRVSCGRHSCAALHVQVTTGSLAAPVHSRKHRWT